MKQFSLSLRVQLVLLVGAAFLVGQALSLVFFADERSSAVQAALGAEAASRAANVALLIESAPSELHQQIVMAASSPLVRFEIGPDAQVMDGEHHEDAAVEARIRALLNDSFSRAIRVEVHEIDGIVLPVPNLTPELAEMHADMMRGTLAALELEISIALSGGNWLNVATRFERPPWQLSSATFLSVLLSAGLGALAVFWFVIARLTRPLTALKQATEALGRGGQVVPLTPAGPPEVKALTQAFNVMQDRLHKFVADRTMMLAALAHDLRSPLTAMRVQSAMVDDVETQASIVRSTEEMSEMVESTLAYARGVGTEEAVEDVLLSEIMERAGARPEDWPNGLVVAARKTAVIRALRNLIENAQRYGSVAEVHWSVTGSDLAICVKDNGPGIPEEQIEQVLEPYVRLEQSRSRETGGAGLGLSIARSVFLAHGGTLALSNRQAGGLCACATLPGAVVSQQTSELSLSLQNDTQHREAEVLSHPR